MSYYSSSTLLDSYNTSSRYDSLYSNNTYNTSGGTTGYGVGGGLGNTASSAIDRYYSYLDDLTSGSSSSSIRTGDYSSGSSRYSSRYSSSSVSDTTSGYSSGRVSSNYLNDYQPISSRYSSTSIGRSLISRTPAYDKYGKELSNYDRWRLNHGESVVHDTSTTNNNNNNNNLTSSSSYGGYLSKQTADYSCNNNDTTTTIKPRSSRRISRIEDSFSDTSPPSSSVLNTSRELSVMPTASNTYPEDLAALPSRFAQMNTRESRLARETGTVQKQRGKSVGPNLLGSSYSNTSSSFGSRGGSSSSSKLVHSFPISVSSKLAGYDVRDVKGDGGCYYRCLSAYFTGAEESYNKYRREVVAYIRDHLDNYSSMIKSEIGYASTNDYFSRKMRTDHQEFAETTEIIATCCLYNINIHVLARVPGKGTWEWLHFDPSIGSGKPSTATRDIYLYNQGSVHFMLCTPK